MKSKFIIPVSFICILLVLTIFIFTSKKDGQPQIENTARSFDKPLLKEEIETSIGYIVGNIASPTEITSYIKRAGGAFSSNILLNTDVDKYLTSKDKALAMGGIGADIAYISLFEKRSAAIAPLNQIRKLSNELHLSQFIDFEMLKELSTSSITKRKMDSLLLITKVRLNSVEDHLLKPGRAETGIFLVIGAWTEGFYLLSHHAQKCNTDGIAGKVAEQKIHLKEMLKWLTKFQHIKEVKEIRKEMKPLTKEMCTVEIKYENIGEPITTMDMDGNKTTYQKKKSIGVIDSTQLASIARESKIFRNKIFKLD